MNKFLWFLPFRPQIEAGTPSGGGSAPTPAPAPPSPTPAPTPGGAPAAPPPATPASGTPPAPTPDPADPADGNWREMRQRYDQQKAQIAELTSRSASLTSVHTKATEMARTLGYTDADFTAAFSADPIGTLNILSEESRAKSVAPSNDNQPTNLAEQIRAEAQRQIAPVNDIVNRQVTEAAMVKYNSSVDTAMTADPILKDAPAEVQSLVKDYLEEYFSTQPNILLAMKTKGDYTAVPDALKFIGGRLHGAFKSWLTKTNPPSPGGQPNPGTPASGGKFSLDDIINDPGVLGSQYK